MTKTRTKKLTRTSLKRNRVTRWLVGPENAEVKSDSVFTIRREFQEEERDEKLGPLAIIHCAVCF